MPVDWNKGEERFNWELLFCEMYAGGKYGEEMCIRDRLWNTQSMRRVVS